MLVGSGENRFGACVERLVDARVCVSDAAVAPKVRQKMRRKLMNLLCLHGAKQGGDLTREECLGIVGNGHSLLVGLFALEGPVVPCQSSRDCSGSTNNLQNRIVHRGPRKHVSERRGVDTRGRDTFRRLDDLHLLTRHARVARSAALLAVLCTAVLAGIIVALLAWLASLLLRSVRPTLLDGSRLAPHPLPLSVLVGSPGRRSLPRPAGRRRRRPSFPLSV